MPKNCARCSAPRRDWMPGRSCASWDWINRPCDLPGAQDLEIPISRDVFAQLEESGVDFTLCLSAIAMSYALSIDSRPAELVLVPGTGKRAARDARKYLKLSNDESDALSGAIEGVAQILAEAAPTVAQLKRFLARTTSESSRRLLRALQAMGEAEDRLPQRLDLLDELARSEYVPTPFINGDDLIAMGFKPGPAFRKIIERIYDEQLEGKITTPAEAVHRARSFL